jgi:hypothetical protein
LPESMTFQENHFINDNKQALNKQLMIFMCNLNQDAHQLNVEFLNFSFTNFSIQFYHKLASNFFILIHLNSLKILQYY